MPPTHARAAVPPTHARAAVPPTNARAAVPPTNASYRSVGSGPLPLVAGMFMGRWPELFEHVGKGLREGLPAGLALVALDHGIDFDFASAEQLDVDAGC